MSGQVATLGLEVRSDQVVAGTANLDKLTTASSQAEAAAKKLSDMWGTTNASVSKLSQQSAQATQVISGLQNRIAANSNTLERHNTASRAAAEGVGLLKDGVVELAGGFLAGLGAAELISKSIEKFISSTIEGQNALAQLNAAIRSNGEAAGRSVSQLQEAAEGLQGISTYSAVAVEGIQALMLSFRNVRGDVFDQATKSALDMAAALHIDLKSASEEVGRALNDPVAGLTSLSRAGIRFSQDQKDTIAALVRMGNVAGAQKIILDDLTKSFGGSAHAARDTLGGALTALGIAWENAFELPEEKTRSLTKSLNDLIKEISSPQFRSALTEIGSVLFEVLAELARQTDLGVQTIVHIGDMLGDLANRAKAAGNEIIGAFVGAYEGIKASWATLPDALGDLAIQAANRVLDSTRVMVQRLFTEINSAIHAIGQLLPADMAKSLPQLDNSGKGGPFSRKNWLLDNPYAGAASSTVDAAMAAAAAAQGKDYLGVNGSSGVEAAKRRQGRGEDVGGGLSGDYDVTKAPLDAIDKLIQAAKDRNAQIETEIKLTGQVGAAADAYRMNQQLLIQAYSRAAEENRKVSDDQVKAIHEVSDAYGQAVENLSRAKLAAQLDFSRSQMFLSTMDQQIASAQHSAGLPVNLNDNIAQSMRQNAQIDQIHGVADTFVNTLQSDFAKGGQSIGKMFTDAFRAAAAQELGDIAKQAMSDLTGVLTKSIAGALGLGGSTGGSTASVGAFAANTTLSAFLGAGANDNYSKGAVTRAPLGAVSDISAYIQQAASARGIDPSIALKVAGSEGLGAGIWQSNYVKNGFREPSFGPFQLLKGGAGTGFPTGLGNQFMAQTGLDPSDPANVRPGVDFALDHAATSGWGSWFGAKKAGVGNWDGLSGAAPIGVNKSAAALDKLTTSATDTAKSLAGGLGELSKSLMSVGGGAGGTGWFSNLMGMFGGAAGATNFMNTISPKATANIASGIWGLFDDGGFTGHGGRSQPAGIVHKGEYVFDAASTSRIGIANLENMRRMPGYSGGGLVGGGNMSAGGANGLHITWGLDSDDEGNLTPYIKKVVQKDAPPIAKQAANGAVGNYAYGQRQGGAATDQRRWNSLKRMG